MVNQRADVVVAGAGIIGASCAYRLAERGLSVVVLEASSTFASGSTGKSAAGVRVQFSEPLNVMLSWQSIQEYQEMPAAGYRPIGYLFLVPPDQWEAHYQSAVMQKELGVPVEVLGLEAARRIISFSPHGLAGATFGPADGVVDPHGITQEYIRWARARGAEFHFDAPLLQASRSGGLWRVDTPLGKFEAGFIVNAAGAWAGQLASRAGLSVPVRPSRRMVFSTAPLKTLHAYPLTIDLSTGFYLRSEGERLLLGMSNPNEKEGFVEGIDWSWMETCLEAGLSRFPWLSETALDAKASWWGYYEVTPDHNPILGLMPGTQGFVNACGFSGHGVQQAAMVGKLIAEEIVDGRAHTLDIDPFRYQRFERESSAKERNIV